MNRAMSFGRLTVLLLAILSTSCSCLTLEDALESEGASLPFKEQPVLALCSTGNNLPAAEWQLKLRDLIKGTNVHIAELSCTDKITVVVIDTSGKQHFIAKEEEQDIHSFSDSVLLELCSQWVTVLHQPSDFQQLESSKPLDILVAFISKSSYTEYTAFLQAVLSTDVPKTLKIAITSSSHTLPTSSSQSTKSSSLRLWTVRDGKWGVIPVNSKDRSKSLKDVISGHIKRLGYPAIVTHSDKENISIYENSGMRLLLMFHHTKQYEEIFQKIIQPLVHKFRAHFAFITIDSDVYTHELRNHFLTPSSVMPYIILLEPGKSTGIHVESKSIPYTIPSLSGLLSSIIDPTVNNVGPPPSEERIRISFTDPKTLGLLVKSLNSPILAGFCAKGTSHCQQLFAKLRKAVQAVSDIAPSLNINLYVVECESIEQAKQFDVNAFPGAAFHSPTEGGWWPLLDKLSVTEFVAIIQLHGTDDEVDKKKTLNPTNFIDEIYSTEELAEDEMIVLLYKSPPDIPTDLPHLTTDNHTAFYESATKAVIVFYYHYCVQSRLLLLHLAKAQSSLREVGASSAVVHCADYPDVCDAHSATKYPSLQFINRDGLWKEFCGVMNSEEMLKLFTRKESEPNELEELTPALLPRVLKHNDRENHLLLLCTNELSAEMTALTNKLDEDIRSVTFWLNSTKYQYFTQKYLSESELPVLLLLNFANTEVHNLGVSKSIKAEQVNKFFTTAVSGKRSPDNKMEWVSWPPKYPAIKFPSTEFTNTITIKEKSSEKKKVVDDDQTEDMSYHDDEELEEGDSLLDSGVYDTTQHKHQHTEL